MTVEIEWKVPEVEFRANVKLDQVHVFLEQIIGGGVAVMVFEDLQKVVRQLEIVWVLEATSSVLNGSIEELPRQVALNVAHV